LSVQDITSYTVFSRSSNTVYDDHFVQRETCSPSDDLRQHQPNNPSKLEVVGVNVPSGVPDQPIAGKKPAWAREPEPEMRSNNTAHVTALTWRAGSSSVNRLNTVPRAIFSRSPSHTVLSGLENTVWDTHSPSLNRI
jgi:hypothetical protein